MTYDDYIDAPDVPVLPSCSGCGKRLPELPHDPVWIIRPGFVRLCVQCQRRLAVDPAFARRLGVDVEDVRDLLD